ncbi:aminoacyl-tRNA hydrolase [bacterium]|nr:aminoacyl-tRNA hydrolase [bacterium]
MKLIVGLGNIGKEYINTRHNVGFFILDLFSAEGSSTFTEVPKLKVRRCKVGDTLLVKPTTFMNLSGQAVRAVCDFYKIKNKDILVIHDDIDQHIGNYKFVESGGAGGHKGILSIFQHLDVADNGLKRLKIGVAPEIYNPMIHKAENFVLKPFSKSEQESLESIYFSNLKEKILNF